MATILASVLMAAMPAFAVPTRAQDKGRCEVREEKIGQEQAIIGNCGKNEVMIAPVESTEISRSMDGDSVAIAAYNSGDTRIFIIRRSSEGSTILEDLTYQFSDGNGNYSRFGINGLSVDLSQFADEGLIGITERSSKRRIGEKSLRTFTITEAERQLAAKMQSPSPSP